MIEKLSNFNFVTKSDDRTVVLPTFLTGEFGQAIHEEVLAKYVYFPSVKGSNCEIVYDKESKVVRGSNPFYVIAVNETLRDNGLNLKTANTADLERVLRTGALPLQGQYEDTALALRDESNPNSYLAGNLMVQLKARNSEQEMPLMIPLYGLDLVKDSNSPHGLSFKLRDDSELIYASILVGNNNQQFSETEEFNGLPKELGKGNRTLYTSDSGLSRLYLGRILGLDSGSGGLANSDGDGRVVVVSAEGAMSKK